MSAVENEGDPRNLLLVYDLEAFILSNFLHKETEIETGLVE